MADQELPPPSKIVPLNFSSIQSVPESHSWLDSDELSAKIDMDGKLSLPLIDLLDDGASELVGRACEQWGMFQLINHGIPESLIAETEAEARRLFALPARQKMTTLQSPGGVGGYGMAGIQKYHEKYMWTEGYTILGSPVDNAKKLWPSDYKRFCDVMEEYERKLRDLSDRLIRLMLKFLGMYVEEEILKQFTESAQPHNPLRLNAYPPCPDPTQVLGLAAHTDTSFFTIVHQVLNDGLQIFKLDGAGWVPLSPMSGTLIVNVGDFLQILSNGRFPSILHRVMVRAKNVERLSLAYFYIPPNDLYISPFVKPVSKYPQLPLYRHVNVKEYFTLKTNNQGNGISAIKI